MAEDATGGEVMVIVSAVNAYSRKYNYFILEAAQIAVSGTI